MKRSLALFVIAICVTCLLSLAACGKARDESPTEPANASGKAASLRVSIIDVGKGDCILVQSGKSAVLIDAGYEKTADDVVSYLREEGISHLGALIITHYDRDHIGGIETIGEEVGIDTIYLPGYEGSDDNYDSCMAAVKALGVPSSKVTKKLALEVGDAQLTVFPSGVAYESGWFGGEGNDNDASLVATLVHGDDSYLFAGDLEEDGVDAYLKAQHGHFDVLKMPHHGKTASNTGELLDDVRPQIAIITDSKKDSADKKTLKLLKSADIELYRTSTDGTIVVESTGSGTYSVQSWS